MFLVFLSRHLASLLFLFKFLINRVYALTTCGEIKSSLHEQHGDFTPHLSPHPDNQSQSKPGNEIVFVPITSCITFSLFTVSFHRENLPAVITMWEME